MPRQTIREVLVGGFDEHFRNAPSGDLNIFGTTDDANIESIRQVVGLSKTSCLFVKDSGIESFMA